MAEVPLFQVVYNPGGAFVKRSDKSRPFDIIPSQRMLEKWDLWAVMNDNNITINPNMPKATEIVASYSAKHQGRRHRLFDLKEV